MKGWLICKTYENQIISLNECKIKLQIEKLKKLKSQRDSNKVNTAIQKIEQTARDGNNLMPIIIDAVEDLVTLGEISDAMRRVFGEY